MRQSLGEYVVTFTASDSSGNRADTVTRSVVVQGHRRSGDYSEGRGRSWRLRLEDKFVDPGASALDGLDGRSY